ncbi:MAG: vWA domain-containing protein, partial [Nannocystaceae bacterium]
DVSDSVQSSGKLPLVRDGLQSLLTTLDAQSQQYRVAIYAFDGDLSTFLGETGDLQAAITALDGLPQYTGPDPLSTDLHGAYAWVLRQLDRDQDMRRLPNENGTLTTGTMLVISDGDDEALKVPLQTAQDELARTAANVITVGLGDVINYTKLSELGRDGSFSAVTDAEIVPTFDSIATRIDQLNQSVYLIGYCSPKRGGFATVQVSIDEADELAQCTFNAFLFEGGCTEDVFDPALQCAGKECGGAIVSCGTCGANECCFEGACQGTSNNATRCGDDDDLCEAQERCIFNTLSEDWVCVSAPFDPMSTGEFDPDDSTDDVPCQEVNNYDGITTPVLCDPASYFCDLEVPVPQCADFTPVGSVCESSEECESGACVYGVFGGGFVPTCAADGVRVYDSCVWGSLQARCESGAYCDVSTGTCQPKLYDGWTCTDTYGDVMCSSGNCVLPELSNEGVCLPADACYYAGYPY